MMVFFIKRLILFGVIFGLAGCAIVDTYKNAFKSFEEQESKLQYHHTSSDFKVSWNTLRKGNDTVIDGLIKNIRNVQVRDIFLQVNLLDSNGEFISDSSINLEHPNLTMNSTVAFNTILKDAPMTKGNVLEFIISYHVNNGSWFGRAEQGRFKINAETGTAIGEQTEQQK